jgi:phenylalanyl-tRNA synthetase alpha chain
MSAEDTLQQARERTAACADPAAVKELEREYLGKKGAVAALLAEIPKLPPEQRKAQGQRANDLKQALQAIFDERSAALASSKLDAARQAQDFDPTLPPPRPLRGGLHPITQVTRELEDLFASMGYEVLDGPEVELDHYNFEALNISGPSRARLAGHVLLRRQAAAWSCARTPRRSRSARWRSESRRSARSRPAASSATRRSTRPTTTPSTRWKASSSASDISVAHLIGAMKTLLRGMFGRDLEVRLRPGYFPFVEPGFELDARCPFCGRTAAACASAPTWIELLPCGLVHPNVLRRRHRPREWSRLRLRPRACRAS